MKNKIKKLLTCSCNGQNIQPDAQQKSESVIKTACDKICKNASTEQKQYEADFEKTIKEKQCICKEVLQNQH